MRRAGGELRVETVPERQTVRLVRAATGEAVAELDLLAVGRLRGALREAALTMPPRGRHRR